jgi:hypothetical protein
MADNYTQFAATLPYQGEEQHQWLLEVFRRLEAWPPVDNEGNVLDEAGWPVDEDGLPILDDDWAWLIRLAEEGAGWDIRNGVHVCQVGAQAAEGDNFLFLWDDDMPDFQMLAGIVCEYQRRFEIAEPWACEWADTCSKSRPGEFGGGALFCYRGEASWMSTSTWIAQQYARLQQEETPEARYLAAEGEVCPYCGSRKLQVFDFDLDTPITQNVVCRGCGKRWADVFTLTGMWPDEEE